MKLRIFYQIYRKKPDTLKLNLLIENTERMIRDEYHALDARYRKNFEEAKYYDREVEGMRERCRWLYSELWDSLEKKGEKRHVSRRSYQNRQYGDR